MIDSVGQSLIRHFASSHCIITARPPSPLVSRLPANGNASRKGSEKSEEEKKRVRWRMLAEADPG